MDARSRAFWPAWPAALLVLTLVACGGSAGATADGDPDDAATTRELACDEDDGGLTLPDGFCAQVVAEDLGRARHLAVALNGDIFVALRGGESDGGGIAALRDTTGDGKADIVRRFGERGGTGIALRNDHLYFGADGAVLRYPLETGALEPSGEPEVIVGGLRSSGGHAAKPIAFDGEGHLYVNIGSPSNACQEQARTPGSPGLDPCPQLEANAGIWRFDADATGQTQEDGERYATGLRNTVALTTNPETGVLYGVVHGRDQLHQNWSDLYTEEESAEKPAEEFVRIEEGDDFGWPYCYFDPESEEKVLAPEYGGDGEQVGRCSEKKDPMLGLPAHWAPNALLFYTGSAFPARYWDGAFIAFHGSWNRAPLPQEGYNVVFVPMEDGSAQGEFEVFAEGFAGEQMNPGEADHRPSGLAMGPAGSLLVSDDAGGTIWRITAR